VGQKELTAVSLPKPPPDKLIGNVSPRGNANAQHETWRATVAFLRRELLARR
jgi:hypothetical protein